MRFFVVFLTIMFTLATCDSNVNFEKRIAKNTRTDSEIVEINHGIFGSMENEKMLVAATLEEDIMEKKPNPPFLFLAVNNKEGPEGFNSNEAASLIDAYPISQNINYRTKEEIIEIINEIFGKVNSNNGDFICETAANGNQHLIYDIDIDIRQS